MQWPLLVNPKFKIQNSKEIQNPKSQERELLLSPGVVGGLIEADRAGVLAKVIYSKDNYIASFCGLIPADNPRLTILIVVDEPQNIYWASDVACPAFARIAEKAMNYLSIKKDGSYQYAAAK